MCFLPKCLSVSESLSLFVCLLGCYPVRSLYLLNVFIVIVSFDFVIQLLFSSIIHDPLFSISFFHSSIGGKLKTWSSSSMIYPYPPVVLVCTNLFVLFDLHRVTFCFCLLFKLSLATTTGVDACLGLLFGTI